MQLPENPEIFNFCSYLLSRNCVPPDACLTLQAAMKEELIPLKKHLRRLYEAKQGCDDTTVHIKV